MTKVQGQFQGHNVASTIASNESVRSTFLGEYQQPWVNYEHKGRQRAKI
jgi:hypothetical protein